MDYIHIENWRRYQHYRDRNPPWIKLYVNLLDDYDYYSLPDNQKLILIHLWLLASKTNNNIPYDLLWIKSTLNLNIAIEIEPLIKAGFLWSDDEKIDESCSWASRYISEEVRKKIFEKYDDQCAICKSTKHLEVDHKLPISQGGGNSEDNLQILCRKCNRKKKASKTDATNSLSSVYQQSSQRREEKRREEKSFFPLKTKKCHRTGCKNMGTVWDTDDTGLRYWMCDEHKKKGAKI